MSIFGMFKDIAGNLAGIKMLQTGSDVLINRHTEINTFSVNSALRTHANEVIKHLFLRGFMEDMREEEAALIKLAVLYKAAEQSDEQHMMALIGDSISKIRRISEGKIRPEVSLQVMGDTGH